MDPTATSIWVLGCSSKIAAKICHRFPALRRLTLLTDDFAVRHELPGDCLGISRVVGPGKGLFGKPDRLLVLGTAGRAPRRRLPCRAWRGCRPTRFSPVPRQLPLRPAKGKACHGQHTSHGLQPFRIVTMLVLFRYGLEAMGGCSSWSSRTTRRASSMCRSAEKCDVQMWRTTPCLSIT